MKSEIYKALSFSFSDFSEEIEDYVYYEKFLYLIDDKRASLLLFICSEIEEEVNFNIEQEWCLSDIK